MGFLLLSGTEVRAAELTTEQYVNLTVTRLQRAKSALEQERRALTEDDLQGLWQQAGTTAEEYYEFMGAHRESVEGYLATHPEVKVQIEALGGQIGILIKQLDESLGQTGRP